MPHDLGRATQSARTFRDRAIPECDDSMPHAKHQPPLAAKLEYPTTIFLPLLNNTQRSNCARVDDDTAHAYASNKRQPAASCVTETAVATNPDTKGRLFDSHRRLGEHALS